MSSVVTKKRKHKRDEEARALLQSIAEKGLQLLNLMGSQTPNMFIYQRWL
jgi:hypothetical protein